MIQYQELTLFAPFMSVIVAAMALGVAWKNLRGLRRSQTLQAQMNLISMENEIRKNHIHYKVAIEEYYNATNIQEISIQEISNLVSKKTNAFENYMTSADKLAALINAKYLHDQFPGRDWKKEYHDIFQKVKKYHEGEDSIIPGKEYMVRNIDETLKRWSIN
jgi:hypothetical protein